MSITQLSNTVTESMKKLVDMKVWIDSTSVTGFGCALVAPEGMVFKSNLQHEILVRVEETEQSIKRTIAIWKRIDEILEEGLEDCEATAFCSKCEGKTSKLSDEDKLCGYCYDDEEESYGLAEKEAAE